MAIDWLEDFLQEITERRSPDEHAMSSTVYKRIAMFDVCLLQLGLEVGDGLSNQGIVIAGDYVEQEQILIDLIRVP